MRRVEGLQAERTTLAWHRTGVSQVGATCVLLRLAVNDGLLLALLPAVVVLALSGVTFLEATRHPSRRQRLTSSAHAGLPPAAAGLLVGIPLIAAGGLLLFLHG